METVMKTTFLFFVLLLSITTNSMCLQCHDPEKDLRSETYKTIKALYPNDKAIVNVNQVRGIWSVSFDK